MSFEIGYIALLRSQSRLVSLDDLLELILLDLSLPEVGREIADLGVDRVSVSISFI